MKLIVVTILFVLIGCSANNELDLQDYLIVCGAYIQNNMEQKSANGYNLKMIQIPKEYLAAKEMDHMSIKSATIYDSLLASYGAGVHFTLTISPNENKRSGDLLVQGTSDYDDYRQRVHSLSFKLDRMLTLKIGDQELKPVIAEMERIYGVKTERNFNLSFVPENGETLNENYEKMEVIFQDQIFDTGISHFHFELLDSKKLPKLKILAS